MILFLLFVLLAVWGTLQFTREKNVLKWKARAARVGAPLKPVGTVIASDARALWYHVRAWFRTRDTHAPDDLSGI